MDRVSFDVARGETLVLLGASGSGKTTALRLINRLLEPSSGKILLDGQDVSLMDPIEMRRRIGYVIQEFGLLPHWTVEQNIAMVPQLLGWSVKQRQERVHELLRRLRLAPEELAERKPHQLSGGQRQRVAIARALAADPSLLLFDEPFGSLDPVTRHEMQTQFLELRAQYRVPSVFVTHDLIEALSVATHIAVLDSGKVETITTPSEFWQVQTPVARAFLETLPALISRGTHP